MKHLSALQFSWKSIGLFFFFVVAIALSVVYIGQRQDIRNQAALTGAKLSLNLADKTQPSGAQFKVGVLLNAGPDSVTAAELHISYDPNLLEVKSFIPSGKLPVVLSPVSIQNGVLSVTLGSQPKAYLKGADVIGTLHAVSRTNTSAKLDFTRNSKVAAIEKPRNTLVSTVGILINPPQGCTCPRSGKACPQGDIGLCPESTPRPSPGCFYREIQCVRAPCNPVIVCPTPASGSCRGKPDGTACVDKCARACPPGRPCSEQCVRREGTCQNQQCETWPKRPTPTARPDCTMPPACAYTAQGCDYTQQQSNTYCPVRCWNQTVVENNIRYWPDLCRGVINPPNACGEALASLTADEKRQFAAWVNQNRPVHPKCRIDVTPTPTCTPQPPCNVALVLGGDGFMHCPTIDLPPGIRYCPITPTPTGQRLEFRVKLAGVTDNKAEGAKIQVKFVRSNGTSRSLPSPLPLTHVSGGVYKANVILNNPYPLGTKYTVRVKGEKHVSVKFCKDTGQTTKCADDTFMTAIKPGSTATQVYDFTGIPLPPGDLPVQDGLVNTNDFTLLKNLMSKAHASLTEADLAVADLDYDEWINSDDAFLMGQTVNTRYDE